MCGLLEPTNKLLNHFMYIDMVTLEVVIFIFFSPQKFGSFSRWSEVA